MKVIALSSGFFQGRRIRQDQVFDVPEGTEAKWFKPVGGAEKKDAAPAKAGKGKAQKADPSTLAELASEKSQGFNDVVGDGADLA